MALSSKEAGPHHLAVKLLLWLRKRGYELPGETEDWYLGKPDLWGRSRRNKYDIEEGLLAWYLSYEGTDEGARLWSDTFGGENTPSSLINKIDQCELIKHSGYNAYRSGPFFAAMKLQLKEEALAALPPKMKTIHIFKCSKCGYRTEDSKRDLDEKYIHSPCGQESRWVYQSSLKEEVARKT